MELHNTENDAETESVSKKRKVSNNRDGAVRTALDFDNDMGSSKTSS